jgi:CrcB protein
MSYLFVFLGGGLGSLLRFGISNGIKSFSDMSFPLSTLLSNIIACVVLAVVTVLLLSKGERFEWMNAFLAIGFCGGLSTFSTFSMENWQLIQSGQTTMAILNMAISIVFGIGSFYLIAGKL